MNIKRTKRRKVELNVCEFCEGGECVEINQIMRMKGNSKKSIRISLQGKSLRFIVSVKDGAVVVDRTDVSFKDAVYCPFCGENLLKKKTVKKEGK